MRFDQRGEIVMNNTGTRAAPALTQQFSWIPSQTHEPTSKSLQGKTRLGEIEKLKWENNGLGNGAPLSWAEEMKQYQKDAGKVNKIQDVVKPKGRDGAVYGLTMRDFWDKRLGNQITGVAIKHAGKDTESSINPYYEGLIGNDEPFHEGKKIKHAGMDTASQLEFTDGGVVGKGNDMAYDIVYSTAHAHKDTESQISFYYKPGRTPPGQAIHGKKIRHGGMDTASQLEFSEGGMVGKGSNMAFDKVYNMEHADKVSTASSALSLSANK
ncbi:hypothetical protein CYMTET_28421, partial [Cymbomonas tetramitiformis]